MQVSRRSALFSALILSLLLIVTLFYGDLKFVVNSIKAGLLSKQAWTNLTTVNQDKTNTFDFSTVVTAWPKIQTTFNQVESSYEQVRIFDHWLKSNGFNQLKTYYHLADAFISTLDQKQIWLVMIQNSNELRASGGFMGSYALVTFDQGKISDVVIEDVYDADGQWKRFVEPPPGVKEYLSAGKGWRLPDANWAAEFPSAASQVKSIIEQTKNLKIDGVMAINTLAFSSILQVLGPIQLPDYDLALSSDNVAQMLQNRPQEFFPGSRQKVHMLEQAKTQTLLKLSNLDNATYLKLLKILDVELRHKNILFFAKNPQLQFGFEQLNWAGSLSKPKNQTAALGLIESNVGINKINPWIDRQVIISMGKQSATIQIDFTNRAKKDNEDNGSLYVNYQRLLLPSTWEVQSITVDDKAVNWDKNNGIGWLNEIGWLVVTPPQATASTIVNINYDGFQPQFLELYKQPGLSATPYTLNTPQGHIAFNLDQDLVIKLQPFPEVMLQ